MDNRKVRVFIENMGYMASKLEEQTATFKSLYNVLSQYPDEAYDLITEKQKIILFSSFINLDKQLSLIKKDEIEALLKKLTGQVYGIKMDILKGFKR